MNCLRVLGEKLAGVEGGITVKKVKFFEGLPMRRGGGGKLCEIFMIDLDPCYVGGEYELSRCVG